MGRILRIGRLAKTPADGQKSRGQKTLWHAGFGNSAKIVFEKTSLPMIYYLLHQLSTLAYGAVILVSQLNATKSWEKSDLFISFPEQPFCLISVEDLNFEKMRSGCLTDRVASLDIVKGTAKLSFKNTDGSKGLKSEGDIRELNTLPAQVQALLKIAKSCTETQACFEEFSSPGLATFLSSFNLEEGKVWHSEARMGSGSLSNALTPNQIFVLRQNGNSAALYCTVRNCLIAGRFLSIGYLEAQR